MGALVLQNYVDGRWVTPSSGRLLDVENPSTGAVIAQVPLSSRDDVSAATRAAAAAFPVWREQPAARRVQYLFRLAERMRAQEDLLCRILVEEMGKSLPDAHAEMKRAIENLEVACGMPVLQQGDLLVGASAGMDGMVIREPIGVFAGIMPFNFPAMVPFWFLPYAIATGNTFVLKPSELVPNTMAAVAAMISDTGLPPGVFNLVNGDREAAEALLEDPRVAGVSFVGSTRVGRIVAEACVRTGKRAQVLGAAKNHLVVMPDARLDDAVRNMISSCFGCAGQRCMAASVVVCVGDATYAEVERRFVAAAREVCVADPLDPRYADEGMLMGPVISARSKAFVHEMIERGVAEGARLALDGRGLSVPGREGGHFTGPTVIADVRPGSDLHRTEVFGPVVALMRVGSLDEALEVLNAHPYANGASIYTASGYAARRFKLEAGAGMIGVNVGIPAPVAHLPFGGARQSFLSDIKTQGRDNIRFFTQAKVVTERWWPEDRP
jgi:malonate-semialdehyde dehydrogenase (acetylating)/methylmalonate-semialdehyde dehydrogenase